MRASRVKWGVRASRVNYNPSSRYVDSASTSQDDESNDNDTVHQSICACHQCSVKPFSTFCSPNPTPLKSVSKTNSEQPTATRLGISSLELNRLCMCIGQCCDQIRTSISATSNGLGRRQRGATLTEALHATFVEGCTPSGYSGLHERRKIHNSSMNLDIRVDCVA